MTKNMATFYLGILFILIGDLFWLGAVFFPELMQKFFLNFSTIEYSEINSEGLTVFRVMIGIIGSLMWVIGILMIPLSENYNRSVRNWILFATGAWVIGDSIISVLGDFSLNVLLNLGFLAIVIGTLFLKADKESAV